MPNRHLKTHQGDSAGQAGAHINRIEQLSPTRSAVFVESPAMRREVQVQVLHPASSAGSRPSFYLLDGVSAGSESGYSESTWTQKTDIEAFFADKNVNVVLPVGGTGSFYTNWKNDDPNLGVNKWESFLAEELPALIDSAFSGNGTNVVGGVSMGALGAANLITHHPKLYTGLASYSGCLDNSESPSQDSVRLTVASKAGDAHQHVGPGVGPRLAKARPVHQRGNAAWEDDLRVLRYRCARRIRQRLHPEWTADCHRRRTARGAR